MSNRVGLIIFTMACLVSCGRSDLDYIKATGKLQEAAFRRDQALIAAARDANSYTGLAMIKEMTEATEANTKERDQRLKSGQSIRMTPKERYESELNYYNKINKIARAYGFATYAPDFDPDK
jgi:urease accessory protein UreF